MMYDLLRHGNTTFVDSTLRGSFHTKSNRLKAVISALHEAQNEQLPHKFHLLLGAIDRWRQNDPNEFQIRGNVNGVSYRLWMESKQALKNLNGLVFPAPDPIMPNGCPGNELLGVYVPDYDGQMEICHAFAYRWAIAAGKITENGNISAINGPFNGAAIDNALYPNGYAAYPAARLNGIVQLIPGDIIAMYTIAQGQPPALGHSLIAIDANRWFAANNAGTFGVATGRTEVNLLVHPNPNFGGLQRGWIDNGNELRRVMDDNTVRVVYMRIP
jgi:hypothetical protein